MTAWRKKRRAKVFEVEARRAPCVIHIPRGCTYKIINLSGFPLELSGVHKPTKTPKSDLQIAVAKAMGWDVWEDKASGLWTAIQEPEGNVRGMNCGLNYEHALKVCLPPLTLDLMWEAEEMLSDEECIHYKELLSRNFDDIPCPNGAKAWLWHSTTEQRAKAWLKVRGESI